MDWAKATARRDEKHLAFGIWWADIRGLTVWIVEVRSSLHTRPSRGYHRCCR